MISHIACDARVIFAPSFLATVKLASGNVIVRAAVGQEKVSTWLIIGIIVFESGRVQVRAAVIQFTNNPVNVFATLRSQKVVSRKVFNPLFVCAEARTISPDQAGVLHVQSHRRNVVDEGVPVAFIFAGVTVEASIVHTVPLPLTVISHLSQSDTQLPDITMSPLPSKEVELIVFILVQDTRVA